MYRSASRISPTSFSFSGSSMFWKRRAARTRPPKSTLGIAGGNAGATGPFGASPSGIDEGGGGGGAPGGPAGGAVAGSGEGPGPFAAGSAAGSLGGAAGSCGAAASGWSSAGAGACASTPDVQVERRIPEDSPTTMLKVLDLERWLMLILRGSDALGVGRWLCRPRDSEPVRRRATYSLDEPESEASYSTPYMN